MQNILGTERKHRLKSRLRGKITWSSRRDDLVNFGNESA
ncbi:hypothetical protein NPIL_130611, partial [Nephila pilipes]